MNARKRWLRVVGILMVTAIFVLPTVASAVVNCAKVSVVRIGFYPGVTVQNPNASGAIVQLKDLVGTCWSGGTRQFYLSSDLGNPGLATLLAGYSMDKTFWAQVGGTAQTGSLVLVLYIND